MDLPPRKSWHVGGLIIERAYSLGADAVSILMNLSAFDHAEARRQLMLLPGVLGVGDIRSWRLCSHLVVCTAHVQVGVERLEETQPLMAAIERVLAEKFRVRHMTVRFETRLLAGEHSHRFVHENETDEHHAHGHSD